VPAYPFQICFGDRILNYFEVVPIDALMKRISD